MKAFSAAKFKIMANILRQFFLEKKHFRWTNFVVPKYFWKKLIGKNFQQKNDTVRYKMIQYKTIWYIAIWCDKKQYEAIRSYSKRILCRKRRRKKKEGEKSEGNGQLLSLGDYCVLVLINCLFNYFLPKFSIINCFFNCFWQKII